MIDVADAAKLVPFTVRSPSTTRSLVVVVPVNVGEAIGAYVEDAVEESNFASN